MNIHQYKTKQFLPIDLVAAWAFFSNARNLAVITPSDMDFMILSASLPLEIHEGMHIDYRVRPLLGISCHWQTEISKVKKPEFFTDRQLKGPFLLWEHTHQFTPSKNGVMVNDEIIYSLPFGALGSLMHRLLVKKRIEHIFAFRRRVLNRMFSLSTYDYN